MVNLIDHQVFKALSEPLRLRIAVLLTEDELCVCDLTHVLSLPQSTVSRHMARLKAAGLVSSRRSGNWVHYKLQLNLSSVAKTVSEYLTSARSVRPYKNDLTRLRRYHNRRACE